MKKRMTEYHYIMATYSDVKAKQFTFTLENRNILKSGISNMSVLADPTFLNVGHGGFIYGEEGEEIRITSFHIVFEVKEDCQLSRADLMKLILLARDGRYV